MFSVNRSVRNFLPALFIAGISWTLPAFADDTLSIPTRERELGVTSSDTLGTNDQGIGLTPGDTVPDFISNSFEGEPVNWDDLRQRGPLLVVFYRGGWCPYCNVQVRQLVQAYPEFEKRGILPVLISVDAADGSSLVQKTYEIPFPVLSDPGLQAHEAFRVTMQVDDATVEHYEDIGIDLEAWSGRTDHKIAVPAIFFVDSDGKVLWAHSDIEYRVRPSPQQLLDVADELE